MNRPIFIILIGYIIGILWGLYLKISIVFFYIFLLILYYISNISKFKKKKFFHYIKILIKFNVLLLIIISSLISNIIIKFQTKKYQNLYHDGEELKIQVQIIDNKKEKQYLGYKYVSGGASPETGFDCSGFTSYVYKHFGISLNRTSKDQIKNGVAVERSNLQPGDIVIFNNSANTAIGHVGIYIGGDNFIHAANKNEGVKITSLSSSYYKTRYVGARRVI